jgi:tetratricopeptide (TPR) repeat protein
MNQHHDQDFDVPNVHIGAHDQEVKSTKKGWREYLNLDFLAKFFLLLPLFILPIFVWPSLNVPNQFFKTLFLVIPVGLSLLFLILSSLRSGKFVYPKTWLWPATALVIVTYTLSSFFSSSWRDSFLGQGYDVGSWVVVVFTLLAIFLVPIYFKNKRDVFTSYAVLWVAALLVGVFTLIRLVLYWILGYDFMSLGVFGDITANSVGTWNSLGVFFGLSTILSFVTLENLDFKVGWFKYTIIGTLVMSLIMVALVNYSLVWYVLGILSVIFLVYTFSSNLIRGSATAKMPYMSLVILFISLVFIINGTHVQNFISQKAGISNYEVLPNYKSLQMLSWETLKTNPVFGVGPNRFYEEWAAHKSLDVNSSEYWNTDFNYAVGFVPTLFITTGLIGFLPWLILIGVFLYFGFRYLMTAWSDRYVKYLALSSFLASIYLWITVILYVPSTATLFLTMFFTGLFLAICIFENVVENKEISFSEPRKGFYVVMVLVFVMIGLVIGCYVYTQKYVAANYYQKALVASLNGDIATAGLNAEKAVQMDGTDYSYRLVSQIYVRQMSDLLSKKDMTAEQIKAPFQSLLGAAVNSANAAVALNSTNYQNYMNLGNVYESVVLIGIPGAYDMAVKAYQKAGELNPNSPLINLTMSRLEYSNKAYTKAKDFALKALNQKNNYTDAAYFLSYIETERGSAKNAIAVLENASVFSPYDQSLFFRLGVMKYNQKDYDGAVASLGRAVNIMMALYDKNSQQGPDFYSLYSNAAYFLSLSSYKVGQKEAAIAYMDLVSRWNPGNKDVANLLSSMKAGRALDVSPAAEVKADLPVKTTDAKTATSTTKTTKTSKTIKK